jgi:hypothetical protein
MSGNRFLFAWIALALTIGQSSGARAEEPPLTGEELFRKGRVAMGEENYDLAFHYFEQSQRVDPALGTLLNMAVCDEKQGRIGAALARMRDALIQAPPTDKRRTLISGRIVELEKRLARLTLRYDASMGGGVTVAIDGRQIERAELGKELLLDPGPHQLKCAGPRGELCAQSFTLSAGETAERPLVITLPAPVPNVPAPTETKAPPPPSTRGSTLAYGLGALGIAGIGVGLAAGLVVIEKKNFVTEHCNPRGCDPDAVAAASSGKTYSWVSTVAMGTGIVALGTSAYLLLSAPISKGSMTAISLSGAF